MVNHTFLPGHRIMVQVQSTLFPLYDRNPQRFVPNIFDAKPATTRKPRSASCTSPDSELHQPPGTSSLTGDQLMPRRCELEG